LHGGDWRGMLGAETVHAIAPRAASMSIDVSPRQRGRRYIQFGLKTMLGSVLVVAAFFGGVVCDRRWKQSELEQVRAMLEWREAEIESYWNSVRYRKPARLRWQIELPKEMSLAQYAQFLDQFQIELGTQGAADNVHYASNFSHGSPATRSGKLMDEYRLRLESEGGKWRDADVELLRRAGIRASSFVARFFNDFTEQRLLQTEVEFARQALSLIDKTRFGVREAESGFEFYVIEQTTQPATGY
jgi:hypothetical protein